MSRVLAFVLTTQILTASGAPASLHLTRSVDRRLSCPANALLEKAVRLRLPAIRIAPEGQPKAADLVASLQRVGGAAWRFEVKRSDGSVAMSRELMPMPCPQLADTSALILERYLSGIDWSGRDVGLAPLPPAHVPVPTPDIPRDRGRPSGRPQPQSPRERDEPVADAGVEVVEVVDIPPLDSADAGVPAELNAADAGAEAALEPVPVPPARRAAPNPLDAPSLTALTLGVGGGAWIGVPLEAAPALCVQVGVRVVRRVHLSLLFLGAPSTLRAVTFRGEPRGTLSLQSFAGFATVSVCSTAAGFSACGGALGGARVTSGGASGGNTGPRLFSTTASLAVLPELGLYGKLSWPLIGRFSLSVDLAVAAPLGQARFAIQGISDADYATPSVDLLGMLYVGLRLF